MGKSLKESTPFKNVKVHVHTKDNKSFVRIWKLNKFGDDLSSFRHSIVKVNSSKSAVNTFELGKAGLSLRSVVPIFDNNNEHLGSLEFMQGLNSVAKLFDKKNEGFMLLMDKRISSVKLFKKEKIYKEHYVISQKFMNKDFLADAQKINIDALLKNKNFTTNKYLYTYIDIKNFQNKKLGIAIVAAPISEVNIIVNNAKDIINISLTIIGILIMAILIAVILSIRKIVITPLLKLNEGIKHLTDGSEVDTTMRIKKDSNDELGELVDNFNKYLIDIHEGIEQDVILIILPQYVKTTIYKI